MQPVRCDDGGVGGRSEDATGVSGVAKDNYNHIGSGSGVGVVQGVSESVLSAVRQVSEEHLPAVEVCWSLYRGQQCLCL